MAVTAATTAAITTAAADFSAHHAMGGEKSPLFLRKKGLHFENKCVIIACDNSKTRKHADQESRFRQNLAESDAAVKGDAESGIEEATLKFTCEWCG